MHASTTNRDQTLPEATNLAAGRQRWRWVVLVLLFLAIGGVVWAGLPNRHARRASALRDQLFSAEGKGLPPEERKAKLDELRAEMGHLTDAQKAEVFAPMREQRKAEMARFAAMSPDDRIRYLDARIDQSERRRQDRATEGAGRPDGPRAGGGPGRGGPGRGPGGSGPTGGRGGEGATPGEPGGTRPTAEDIVARRKERLDATTPEERAQMDLYRAEMRTRLQQRGLSR